MSWRAISSDASRLVLSAVSSILCSRVALPELTSIGDQRLGLVDDEIAARPQHHVRAEHRVQLPLDLEAGEERLGLLVGLTTFLAWLGISMRMKSFASR